MKNFTIEVCTSSTTVFDILKLKIESLFIRNRWYGDSIAVKRGQIESDQLYLRLICDSTHFEGAVEILRQLKIKLVVLTHVITYAAE